MSKTFAFWTIGDQNHGKMAATMVASARAVGVTAPIHVFTDLPSIDGAIVHPCGIFDKTLYMFKFHFLKNEMKKLPYDFMFFLDTDNVFTRNPGDLAEMMGDDKVFVQMENEIMTNSPRKDWWGCPVTEFGSFMKSVGVPGNRFFNCNAGFWGVAKTAIDEFYDKATYIFNEAHKRGYKNTTEEFALSGVGMCLQDPLKRTLDDTSWLWCSDWTNAWKGQLPTYNFWQFEDYMNGQKKSVKPCITHCMRSKEKMISVYDESQKLKVAKSLDVVGVNIDNGFFIGHQMLGDTIGFCAAAHLLHVKTGKNILVSFDERRKDAANYFDGIEWVPRKAIPNAIDCGVDPSREEWSKMNGVKRFYRWMDPSMNPGKSFDIHMKCKKNNVSEKMIGLITHANTQGDIPVDVITEMIAEAKEKYPEHKIVLFGNRDNTILPDGVFDLRQDSGDINWIINFMKRIDLLIAPQTGPCFIAAGLGIPMWIYRSKETHWDYVLNYDSYKVEKWWDRRDILLSTDTYSVFNNLYKSGGWAGMGSGPGSHPDVNKEYLTILNKIIRYTPSIKTVLDIGCGDWQIMQYADLETVKYTGIDVSSYVIENNRKKFGGDFRVLNPVIDDIPYADLIICKDMLQHLPTADVLAILNKIKEKSKYSLITNDYTDVNSRDTNIGGHRPLNILLNPFNWHGVTIYGYIGKQVVLGMT